MVQIVRPGQLGSQGQAQISLGVAGQAGAGRVAIGRELAAAGSAFGRSGNQLNLAKQVAAIVDQGAKEIKRSKEFDNGALLNKTTEATEKFLRAKQQRYNRTADENGNPTYSTLHKDIEDIGNNIMQEVSAGIADPEVAKRFTKKFSNYVANQKLSALKEGMHQELQYNKQALDTGLATIVKQASSDELDQLPTYEQEGLESLQNAYQQGVISYQDFQENSKAFSAMIRDQALRNNINKNRGQVSQALQSSPDELGISEEQHKNLTETLDAAIRSDQIQAKKIKERQEIDDISNENLLVENIESRIEADAIREDEFLGYKEQISDTSFENLKKKFIKSAEKRQKEQADIKDLNIRIQEGRNISAESPSRINKLYEYKVRQFADSIGRDLSLQEKAILASGIPAKVSNFAKTLDNEAKNGDLSKAGDIIASYSYINDRGKPTLDSGFSKESRIIMEHAQLLHVKAGLDPVEALRQSREIIKETNEEIRSFRQSQFKNIDNYKASKLEETAASNLKGAETFFTGTNLLNTETALTYKKLVEEAYLQHGNQEAAEAYANRQMAITHGVSNVGPEEQYVFNPPEREFPGFTADEINSAIRSEARDLLPEGVELESVGLRADNLTPTTVIQTATGPKRIPVWNMTYRHIDEDGNELELPLIDPETQSPMRWFATEGDLHQIIAKEKEAEARRIRETVEQIEQQPQAGTALTEIPAIRGTFSASFASGKPVEEENTETVPVKTESASQEALKSGVDKLLPNADTEASKALKENSDTLSRYGIDNKARMFAFLAQISHESGNFKHLVEQRSASSANRKYGPGTKVGRILGNTQPGDGNKFKGRGLIQLTGRSNYEQMSKLIGKDLVSNPDLAADPNIAVEIAAAFWNSRGLNELADQGKFKEITRRINGGFNGIRDRLSKFKKLLGE